MTRPTPIPDSTTARGHTHALFLMLVAGLVAGVVITTVAGVALFMHRTETLHAYPASPSNGYAAAVKRIHSPTDLDHYEIWLGPLVGDDVPRGHVVAVPPAWSTEPRVEWTPDTVVMSFEPGGEIRVPMTMVLDKR